MRRSLLLASLSALLATPVMAQVPLVPGALSIGGGVELPQGDGSRILERGLTAQGAYRIGIPLTPFAMRLEGSWSRFSGKAGSTSLGTVVQGTTQVLSGGAAAEMTVLPLVVFRGYLIGGVGYTRTSISPIGGSPLVTASSENGLGFSAGVGAEFRLPFVPSAGIEVRYRYTPDALGVLGALRSIPITARLTF